MTNNSDDVRCLNCGFEAPEGSDAWETFEHVAMGELPKCPECDSTSTTALSEQQPDE